MEYIGIKERSFYKEATAYATHVAVFKNDETEVYATPGALNKAMVSNSQERKELKSKGIDMRLIELAHQDFSYRNVRNKISQNEFPLSPKEDFLVKGYLFQDNNPYRGQYIVGNPVTSRYLGGPYMGKSRFQIETPLASWHERGIKIVGINHY